MFNPFKKTTKPEKKKGDRGPEEKKPVDSKPASPPELKKDTTYPLGVLIAPRLTEKATMLSQSFHQYVFEIAPHANAQLVKRAVRGRYGVKVEKVHIMHQPGKHVRVGRREGWRKGFKKAIVTLEKGQSIEFT